MSDDKPALIKVNVGLDTGVAIAYRFEQGAFVLIIIMGEGVAKGRVLRQANFAA
ncbi:hypothetical protein GCM10028827_21020 [Mucilaginibacter myungsuensis]